MPRCLEVALHRGYLRRRTVTSDEGGILKNGPFSVKLQNFRLVYREGDHSLTLPVEPLLDGSQDIGTALIRHWDQSSAPFGKDQVEAIKRNIFAALNHMGARYTNVR
jgi:hypothetical protein